MFCRSAIPVLLLVLLSVLTAEAQTDTGPPPKVSPRKSGPSAAPGSMTGAVCSDERPQKTKLSLPFKRVPADSVTLGSSRPNQCNRRNSGPELRRDREQ